MELTAVPLNMLGSDAQFYGFKNRIINDAMMIDQRNAGAAVTVTDNSVNSTQSSASITDNGSDADGGQLTINNLAGLTANRVAAVLSSSAGSIILSAEL